MQILRELKKQFVVPSFAVLAGRSSYLCLLLLLCTVQLRADVTGSISGYVRDASGGVLPNATLTVTQTSTGYTRIATTDGSGQYSILALPPGNYRLAASMAGFENGAIDKIDLNVNDALKFGFVLKVGNVSQTVSVDASTSTTGNMAGIASLGTLSIRALAALRWRRTAAPRVREVVRNCEPG